MLLARLWFFLPSFFSFAYSYMGCIDDPPGDPLFSAMALFPSNNDNGTAAACVDACSHQIQPTAGISEGIYCLCSSTSIIAPSASFCNTLCPGNDQCGNVTHPQLLSGYATMAQPVQFNFTAEDDGVSLNLEFFASTELAEFYIDLGTETPYTYIQSVTNLTGTFSIMSYFEPGNYTINIAGINSPFKLIEYQTWNVLIPYPPRELNYVVCPLVMEPNITYSCNISMKAEDEYDSFTATFANDLASFSIPSSGEYFLVLGVRPPPGVSLAAGFPGTSSSNEILLLQHAATAKATLIAYEAYPSSTGTVKFTVKRPICPSGQYCIKTGGCLPSCPYDAYLGTISCTAGYLCSLKEKCSLSSDVCFANGGTPIWQEQTDATRIANVVTLEGYRVAVDFEVLPGDVLSVTGAIAETKEPILVGDTVDGVYVLRNHYFAGIIKQEVPINLYHSCVAVSTDSTLTVINDVDPLLLLTSITACERVIADISMFVRQFVVTAYDSTINLEVPYYIRTDFPVELVIEFSTGGPLNIDFFFDPPLGFPVTLSSTSDYPMQPGGLKHQLSQFISMSTEGNYTVNVTAYNQHNTLMNLSYPFNESIIMALYPVLDTWTVNPSVLQGIYSIPSDNPAVVFSETTGSPFPSLANITLLWGDMMSDTRPFLAGLMTFVHMYAYDGNFTVMANITNAVSSWYGTCKVMILEDILNFAIVNTYYLSEAGSPRNGFGKYGNMFPVDKNVTFNPIMSQGTVSSYIVKFTNNDSVIFEYFPEDMFNPIEGFIHHFNTEGITNITVVAQNALMGSQVDLTLEITGIIRILRIQDFFITTIAGETKNFMFTFESIGAGTCLVVDWGDGSPYVSFGEEFMCKTNFSHAIYDPTLLLNLENFYSHKYLNVGMYNVSATAYNDVNQVYDWIVISVTDLDCNRPNVSIINGVYDFRMVEQYPRSSRIIITSKASLNCALTTKTKKQWKVYPIDAAGFMVGVVPVMNILSSWNQSELLISSNFLNYGIYKAIFALTMYDPPVLGHEFPVIEAQVYTFFEVIKSALVGRVLKANPSLIKIGISQYVHLQPAVFSVDPDFPDQRNFSVQWRCRQAGELWPPMTPEYTFSLKKHFPGYSGCFGRGPGLLNTQSISLVLYGWHFIAVGRIYEIQAIVTKDTRTQYVSLGIDVEAEETPFVEIRCLTMTMCMPHSSGIGVSINPSARIAVLAQCIEKCYPPLTFRWEVTDDSGYLFPNNILHFPVGVSSPEFAIDPSFFDAYSSVLWIKTTVYVTNSDLPPNMGYSSYYMHVNQKPKIGHCSVSPIVGWALINNFLLTCFGFRDPENRGIRHYTVEALEFANSRPLKLIVQPHYFIDPQKMYLVFPAGNYSVYVTITDVDGTCVVVEAADNIMAKQPGPKDVQLNKIQQLIDVAFGVGDSNMLNMLLGAQAKYNQMIGSDALTDEEGNDKTLQISLQHFEALVMTSQTANYKDIHSITCLCSSLACIMDSVGSTEEFILTLGRRERLLLLEVLEKVAENLREDSEVVSPSQMKTLGKMMAKISGVLLQTYSSVVLSTEDENYDPVPLIDYEYADQFEYDTDIGDDIEMVVPQKLSSAKNKNIRELTKLDSIDQIPRLLDVMNSMSDLTLQSMIVGEGQVIEEEDGVCSLTTIFDQNELQGRHFVCSSSVYFPLGFCPLGDCREPVGLALKEWPAPTHMYVDSVSNLDMNSHVLQVNLTNRNLEALDVQDPLNRAELWLHRTVGTSWDSTLPGFLSLDDKSNLISDSIPVIYTALNVSQANSSAIIEITADSPQRLFLMMSKSYLPTLKKHDFYTLVSDLTKESGKSFSLFLSTSEFKSNGTYYLGVGEFLETTALPLMKTPKKFNVSLNALKDTLSGNCSLRILTSGCYSFSKNTWQKKGIKDFKFGYEQCHCESTTQVGSFSSGLFVAPNTVDFTFVFANMGFTDNITIYLTIIITLALFIVIMIWARYKDKKDIEKLGVTPLPDNYLRDRYLYEVLVFTGDKRGAQTDSVVQFILSGDKEETDVRIFGDDKRKIFRKAGVDVFLMAVPRPLGDLEYLRIWHDNSGKGISASWYLSYIVFRDLQTGKKYEFICNKWLAVEKDGGQVERLLEVADNVQKFKFSHLFQNTSSKNLQDGHLWFSVFLRPARSRFTRCQRVGCCFSLLYLSMLVSAMWYGTTDDVDSSGFVLGPFLVTCEQIGVGFLSNLIVFPVTFLIIFLFRKSSPRQLRPSRIKEALERTKIEAKEKGLLRPVYDFDEERWREKGKIKRGMRKRKFTLPWWCRVLSWLLVSCCFSVSIFFLIMYGVMFGNEKVIKWLTSLVFSFFSSVLFVQPFKTILLAVVASLFLKTGDLDEDDADDDEEQAMLCHDEVFLHDIKRKNTQEQKNQLDKEILYKLKGNRMRELEMWNILKELGSYCFFIWAIVIITVAQRDPSSFYLQKTIHNEFVSLYSEEQTDFLSILTTSDLWSYVINTLIPNIRVDRLYNDKPGYQLKGFFTDQANRIMGFATIRQVRTTPKDCRVPTALSNSSKLCSGHRYASSEIENDFCIGWKIPSFFSDDNLECSASEFKFTPATQLGTFPHVGLKNTYGGGGYIFGVKGPTEEILQRASFLQKHQWIDVFTRAVIIEFPFYNSQVNLFGNVLLIAEYTEGGGIATSYKIKEMRLLQHHGAFGVVVLVADIIFILFTLYFTVRELRLFIKQHRHEYFKSYWVYAEIATIVASYLAMVIFVVRYFETVEILKVFHDTYGNGYVNIQYAGILDDLFGYLTFFVLFVGILKFIKLLRFNKRIGILSATLATCWDELKGFIMAVCISFLSFVSMFYLMLNTKLTGFSSFITSVETCFSMMLGKFSFEEMSDAHPFVPILFFIFVLINSFVLINLLLTLIIVSFEQTRADIMKQPSDYQMVDFVWHRFKALVGYGTQEDSAILENSSSKKSSSSIADLPSKVDKMLEYINHPYLDGKMEAKESYADINSKGKRSGASIKKGKIFGTH